MIITGNSFGKRKIRLGEAEFGQRVSEGEPV